jgi:hypothetical protein
LRHTHVGMVNIAQPGGTLEISDRLRRRIRQHWQRAQPRTPTAKRPVGRSFPHGELAATTLRPEMAVSSVSHPSETWGPKHPRAPQTLRIRTTFERKDEGREWQTTHGRSQARLGYAKVEKGAAQSTHLRPAPRHGRRPVLFYPP